MLVISESACTELLEMRAAIPAVADSFRAISSGQNTAVRGSVLDPAGGAGALLLGGYGSGAPHRHGRGLEPDSG